jgi:hypothetical protein
MCSSPPAPVTLYPLHRLPAKTLGLSWPWSGLAALLLAPGALAKPWIGVKGNQLVDGEGRTVRLI